MGIFSKKKNSVFTHSSDSHRSSGTHHTFSSLGGPSKRNPTDSSYFSFGGVKNGSSSAPAGPEANWMYAKDARAQVANAPPPAKRGYPSYYGNKESLGTQVIRQANGGYTHSPLLPGQTTAYKPGMDPGAWRSLYNDNDRNDFDTMYHDPKKPNIIGKNNQFSKGNYHSRA